MAAMQHWLQAGGVAGPLGGRSSGQPAVAGRAAGWQTRSGRHLLVRWCAFNQCSGMQRGAEAAGGVKRDWGECKKGKSDTTEAGVEPAAFGCASY